MNAEPQSPAEKTPLPAPHGIASAYWDVDGWLLFADNGDVVEELPAGWPKRFGRPWLESQGVEIAV